MKRTAIFLVGLVLFFEAAAFAVDHADVKAGKSTPVADARVTRMKAAGTVTEISDTVLKIERTVKEKMEGMEFILDKPVAKIAVGDKVQVSYILKADKNVATKVTKTVIKKTTLKPIIKAKPIQSPPEPAVTVK
jgi:hypothetical protein